jgi:lysophospholipase L1-like esterase
MATDLELIQRLSKGFPRSEGYMTVPPGWGMGWLRARDEARTRLAVVGVIADSIAKGSGATDQWGLSWTGLLRSELQGRFGNGGSGFVTVDLANGGNVVATGAWDTFPSLGSASRGGPGGVSYRPTTAGNGATLTFPVDGSKVEVIMKTHPTYGRVDVQVDGGATQQVLVNTALSVLRFDTGVTTPGPHTVKVTAAVGVCEIYGVSGRNTTGVVLDNYSGGGLSIAGSNFNLATVTVSGSPNTYTTDSLASMGAAGSVDVLVFAVGINDVVLGGVQTFEALMDNLTGVFARAINEGVADASPPDLIIQIEHGGKADGLLDTELAYTTVVMALRAFADGMGALVVDVWGAGQRSWKAWQNLGWWSNGNTDLVHPENRGHRFYYEQMRPAFIW